MIPYGTRVYFAVQPADLRKSFTGLAALASAQLAKDPTQGGLFVFCNRKASQVRILFRDPHGWCLLCKRLDRGKFRRPPLENGSFVWELDAPALLHWLDDVEPTRVSVRRARAAASRFTLLRAEAQSMLAREPRPV
jgi:transposase